MQTLDVISVNLWQIIISLLNLLLLFLIIKFFLFKPVKKMLAKRQALLDEQYVLAEKAKKDADENKELWKQKLDNAKEEADRVINEATETAQSRGDKIIKEAENKADGIINRAKVEAELELKKAEEEIKNEIVDVSAALTEKMLGREINEQDHRTLIDSFIGKLGENDEDNQ